jgi:hypothetical protein
MPIYYYRDDANRRVVETSVGKVTLQDMVRVVDQQVADGVWGYDVVADARSIGQVPTPAELRQILQHIGAITTRHGPRGRVALVTSDPELSRTGTQFAEVCQLIAMELEVFQTIDEARHWLDAESAA